MMSSSFGSANLLSEQFECTSCRKIFKYDSHYQRHILTHSDQRPYACDFCGKKFKRQDALKTHEKTHSVNLPFKCSIGDCSQGFASKAALRYHELRHSNNNEFICRLDECNKEFLTLGQLKQHQRTKIHSISMSGGKQASNEIDESQQPQQQLTSGVLGLSQTILPKSEFISGTSISSITTINAIDVKNKGILKEETFLDEFSHDEQLFINQIWSQVQNKKNLEMYSNNAKIESSEGQDIPKQKKIHLESFAQENDYSSDRLLLSEFSRISSLGSTSSFGQLKQELRIIVGVIAKIQNGINSEDSDEIPDEVYDIYSKQTLARKSSALKEEEDEYEGESPILVNSQFYQNDSKLFFSAECSEKQQSLIRQVIEEKDQAEDPQASSCKKGGSMMKIKAAVSLISYSKKQLLEQRKKKQLEIYEKQGNYLYKTNNSLKRNNSLNQQGISINQKEELTLDNNNNNNNNNSSQKIQEEFNPKKQQFSYLQQPQQLFQSPIIHHHHSFYEQPNYLPINVLDHQQRAVMMMVPQLQLQQQQQSQQQLWENKQLFQKQHPPMYSSSPFNSNGFSYSAHCFSSHSLPFMNIPQIHFLETILSSDNSDRPNDDSSQVCMPSEAEISEENMNIFDADDFNNQDRNRMHSEEFLQFMNPHFGAYI